MPPAHPRWADEFRRANVVGVAVGIVSPRWPALLVAAIILAASLAWWIVILRRRVGDERLRAEASLGKLRRLQSATRQRKRRLQQFSLMFSQMRDGVLLIDPDGNIIRCNPSAEQLLNLAGKLQSLPAPAAKLIRHPGLRDAIGSARLAGDVTQFDVESDDGDRVWFLEVTVSGLSEDEIDAAVAANQWNHLADESAIFEHGDTDPIRPASPDPDVRDSSAAPRWVLVLLRDQSERYEMESMRRDLTANLSHELKTPLAAIKGYAETIDLAIDDDVAAAKHFMSQLHDQCRRMENMIADMLQLTRVQSQDGALQYGPVALQSTFDAAIAAAEILASQKQIELACEPLEDRVIQTDQEALLTILNNLIGNAVRYTPVGGRVTTGVRMVGDDQIVLHVEDNGVGIADEDQSRVFDRFYRVQRIGQPMRRGDDGVGGSGPSTRSGTGLGLSIVRTLAKTLGGSVSIDSELGRGSRFEVTLPTASPKLHKQNAAAGGAS